MELIERILLRSRRRLRLMARPVVGLGALESDRLEELIGRGRVKVGRHTYGVPRIVEYLGDVGTVRIGAFCSIGEDVEIFLGGNHRGDWVSTFPFKARFEMPGAFEDGHPASKGDVSIGNDVWIGRGASILSGVTIGNGAIVGARTIVTKDVYPYAIVVGSPAQEVRKRFSQTQIDRLERLKWWEWEDERIMRSVPLLSGDSIDEFLRVAESQDN